MRQKEIIVLINQADSERADKGRLDMEDDVIVRRK
jgi:hypothetical protein